MNARTPLETCWLERRHLDRVLAIEAASFAEGWTEEDFVRTLRDRNVIGQVAILGGRLVAYILYDLAGKRFEILNLAVDPEMRLEGIGSHLVAKLAGKLDSRRTKIVAMVPEGNLGALHFFKARGFLARGLFPAFFEATGEDGIRMVFSRFQAD